MRQLVRIAPEGGTILDPFAGSGSTGVAALAEGRHFIGIEQSAANATTAEERLAAA
jgi:site-specific DNA-methyltransferase (adenine-specific)